MHLIYFQLIPQIPQYLEIVFEKIYLVALVRMKRWVGTLFEDATKFYPSRFHDEGLR